MAKTPLADQRVFRANWAGNVEWGARSVEHPRSEGEIVHHIARAVAHHSGVRPLGAGHSFSEIGQAKATLLTLDHWRGLVAFDDASGDVTLRAGTRLWEIGPMLRRLGRALPTMGDIDRQSIAGAISTGTHGTGAHYTGFSALVTGVRIALASGDVVWADREHNPRLFEAARLGLGAVGILTEVRISTVPLYMLERREYARDVEEVVAQFDELTKAHDHVEFFWAPGEERAVVRELDHVGPTVARVGRSKIMDAVHSELLGNGAFGAANAVARKVPAAAPRLRRVISAAMPNARAVDLPYVIFAESRRVKFRETELAVDFDKFGEVFAHVKREIAAAKSHVIFPLEVRRARRDDVWMSGAASTDVAYIAAHIPVAEKDDSFLRRLHDVLAEHGGRPHFGKMHWLEAADLAGRYAHFEDFVAVRDDVDPQRIFSNAYLDRVIGA